MGQEPNGAATDLSWLLQDLVGRVPDVQHAVVLSADGLLMASSLGIARDDADRLSAVASGLQSLAARGLPDRFDLGELRQTSLEFDDGYVFVVAAGYGARLVVVAGHETDMGQVSYEMVMLVKRVAEHLAAQPRTSAGQNGR
ncbi:roadblock/LC7 domain-containing protein [Dactylosporangium sp. NPDC005572]|uniref:roadblock/LC7 domain-containing protein n=1 Tax=Dactylosporangium sp. NPDC005572 TaxID=3156889 RepID=UPI0033B8C6D1